MKRSPNEIRKLQFSGFYKDIELQPSSPDVDRVEEKYNSLTGDNTSYEYDSRHTILEMHVNLDLIGFEDTDKGEPTEIQLPW